MSVLVNDFGAVNIDAALVEDVEENTISLTNGCICCEVRDDISLLGRWGSSATAEGVSRVATFGPSSVFAASFGSVVSEGPGRRTCGSR